MNGNPRATSVTATAKGIGMSKADTQDSDSVHRQMTEKYNGHVRNAERFLPTQPMFRDHFEGSDTELLRVMYSTIMHYSGLQEPEQEFKLTVSDRGAFDFVGSPPVNLRFLEFLARIKQPRRILEVGAFIGMSAMSMARGLAPGGKLVSIEKYDHFAAIARQNFEQNGFSDRIELVEGDAFQVLREMVESGATELFDMAFLDGDKGRYPEYFEFIDQLLAPNALLIVDDVFFSGDVFNPVQRTEKGAGVHRFLEQLRTNDSYHKLILPVGDGQMLLIRR